MRLGEYEVERELARGGQGAVWLARRASDGLRVAIKVLLGGATRAQQRRRFAREVEALQRVRHPHVVALLGAGEHEGRPYLVMEYVPGTSLEERLRAGSLHPRDAALLVRKLALALEHAHQQNVLHRDVKPGNVLLDPAGEPRLTDFGLTRDVDPSQSATLLSSDGRFLGTPGYLAPEQARGELDSLGPTADVYGLGALLYATLTGGPPYRGEGLLELLARMTSPPERPSRLRPGVDPELEEICLRCLAPDPAGRYPRAADLAAALGRWLERPPGRPGRRRQLRWAARLGVAALVGLGGWVAWRATRPDPRQQAWAILQRPTAGTAARAAPLLASVLEREPDDPTGLALRALVRTELDDPTGAEADAERAAALAPACALAHYARAWVLFSTRRRPAAMSALQRAIDLDPHQAPFFVLQGWLIAPAPGEPPEVTRARLAAYERALTLDPTRDDVAERVATLHVHLEDYPAAIEGFSRLIALRPTDHEAWSQRAGVKHLSGDLEGTLADLGRALEMNPRYAMGWLKRAAIREEQGDLAGAIEDYERYLALEPSPRLSASVSELRARLAAQEKGR